MPKASKSPALVLAFGGKPKDEGEDDGEEYEGGDLADLAQAAFPDEEWTPERLTALKEYVMACMES